MLLMSALVALTCSSVFSHPRMVCCASSSIRRLFAEVSCIAPLRFEISPESFSEAAPQLSSIVFTRSELCRFSKSFLALPASAMNTADIAAYSIAYPSV